MNKVKNMIFYLDPQDWLFGLLGVCALFFSIVGFLGFWPFDQESINKILFGAIGLIILSLFSLVYSIKKIIQKIDITDTQSYKTTLPDTLQDDLIRADTIFLYGMDLFKSVDKYFHILQEKAEAGKILKFLIADPKGNVIEMTKLRYPTNDAPINELIKKSLKLLNILKLKSPETIEIKVLDYLFPRKAMIIDANRFNSCVYVTNYTFRLAGEKARCYYKKGKGNYYDFFLKEFYLMWDAGKLINNYKI